MADEEATLEIPEEAPEEEVVEAPVAEDATTTEEEETEAPLTRGQRRAQRHRELVETNRRTEERLERALAALEEKGQQAAPTTSEPDRDQFDDYETYLDARADWRAVQAVEQRTQAESQQARERAAAQEAQQVETRWSESHDNAIDAHDDYEDIFEAVGRSIDASQALAIKTADDPAEVVYHLGKNPKEMSKFKALSGAALLRAVGRIEERLVVQREQRSNAPKPVTPVRGGQPSSNSLSDDLSTEEWVKRRYKQMGRS